MPTQKSIVDFLRKVVSIYDREEQGYPPPVTNPANVPPEGPGINRSFSVATTDVAALVPPGDKLLLFRSLTGIDTVPALRANGHSVRSAPNIGIYTRVVRNERKAAFRHKGFRILVSTCLAAQIIVAATLTALGAANGSHKAVTAFGAINTIIAGLLTYLKGSGLPTKLKTKKDEWKKVREYIEQREREFCLAECPLNIQEEIQIVENMYQRVSAWLETGNNPEMPQYSPPEIERPRSILSMSPSGRRYSLRPDMMTPAPIAEEKRERDQDDRRMD
ncbi:hypothetical protein BHE90_005883 [Fusarium euwallaceae]|uniref:SMODS and SLOG-associating 2TM effector domain-containing protein n=2 Tax=Fusarium solani species complex TaxID=232080 RepID=A0A3M2S7P3_9HYPO|nr:hypothetical protein CDV36_006721 [Fusarium kuroshium]RTE79612.1 hypothetical protein BHE90_005883 [Fusarium euwallaceae]